MDLGLGLDSLLDEADTSRIEPANEQWNVRGIWSRFWCNPSRFCLVHWSRFGYATGLRWWYLSGVQCSVILTLTLTLTITLNLTLTLTLTAQVNLMYTSNCVI